MTTFHDTQYERGKVEILTTLAHELRNRLQTILFAASDMEKKGAGARAVSRAGALIEGQVSQLLRLVDDLFDVGQWTTGKLSMRRERTNLASVVNMAVDTCHPAIVEGAHKLVLRLPPQAVYVQADPLRLAQVLVNLIDNSAKYSEHCGQIVVSVERDANDAIIRIQDDGMGIPADFLPHVFDLFVQADHSMERPHGGLGIGLSLVKRIVELHGGTVEAQSAGPGCGSVFTVHLPAEPSSDYFVGCYRYSSAVGSNVSMTGNSRIAYRSNSRRTSDILLRTR